MYNNLLTVSYQHRYYIETYSIKNIYFDIKILVPCNIQNII